MLIGSEDKRFMKWIQSPANKRFSTVNSLGEGGYAYTFQAYDAQLGHNVAIKIPKKGDIIEEGFKAALLCPHDHIVKVYDIFQYDDDKRALLMEFIEGGDLRRRLPQLHGNIETAVKITIHICKALKHAHEYNIEPMVHCDVKPENILISFPKANFSWKAAIAKLTDFGIARGVNTSISEAVGSLPYMAPEQIEKIKKIGKINGEKPDVRWDLYAATVVLYEILEGKTPFEGKTEDLIEKITNDSPEMFRDDTPKGLKRIVYKGLEKNPADRYQTASDMLCDLEVFQYFNTEIIRVTEEIGGKYPDQPKAYLKLSEMYIYQSIEVLDHLRAEFESEQPDASTSFHIALLHGAANEYDEAEAAILETQQLDLENPAHPLKQEHPFIKRFVAPKVDDELPPEENTDSGEKDIDYTDKINEVKQLLSDGKYESARKAADEILNSCAKPEIYLSLCSLFYEEAISDQVIDICERGIKLHENHAELHAFLGRAAYGIDSKKAEKAIEKAIQLGYKDTDLVNRLKALKK